jgi:uncharacterized membrane-anchored protein
MAVLLAAIAVLWVSRADVVVIDWIASTGTVSMWIQGWIT